MPRNYPRADRVEQLAREILGEAIQGLKDPRVGFATVTNVELSRDLRTAKVYVSALGTEEERNQTISAIQHATPHLRSVLGRQVSLRRLPDIEIVEDQAAEATSRIEQLLRSAPATNASAMAEAEEEESEE